MAERYFTSGDGRLFLQKYGSGPANAVTYLGCHAIGGADKAEGDVTPMWCPSAKGYGSYDVVGTYRGEESLPTTTVTGKLGLVNPILNMRCEADWHVHLGKCGNPTDFDQGWEIKYIFANGTLTNKSTDDLIALNPGDRSEIMVNGDLTAEAFMEVRRMNLAQKAAAEIVLEAVDVVICDAVDCGDCGDPSDGCEKIYVVVVGSGAGSPGLPAELVYSEDGGLTWADEDIDTLATGEDPAAIACAADWIIVVSTDSASIHLADKGTPGTWTEVTTGFVAGNAPIDIFVYDPTNIWIVGQNGYIYYSNAIADGVAVQNAGDATTQHLQAVHGISSRFVVAVGLNTAVVYTEDGENWVTATGTGLPAATTLNTVWVRSEYEWMIGGADGRLYYTTNKGATFTEKSFSGNGAGQVRDIIFTPTEDGPVGYMSHDTATPAGRIFRTTNGGESWYLMPFGPATIPANDRINALAGCVDPNVIWGVGLADDGSDGIALYGSG